jgi:hypothetical protein
VLSKKTGHFEKEEEEEGEGGEKSKTGNSCIVSQNSLFVI